MVLKLERVTVAWSRSQGQCDGTPLYLSFVRGEY